MSAHVRSEDMFSRVLALCLVGSVGLFAACASLREAEAPAVALLDCTARAVEPVVGTLARAREVARDLQAKRVNVEEILLAAHATAEQSARVYSDLRACAEDFKAALSDAGAAGSGGADAGDAGAAP